MITSGVQTQTSHTKLLNGRTGPQFILKSRRNSANVPTYRPTHQGGPKNASQDDHLWRPFRSSPIRKHNASFSLVCVLNEQQKGGTHRHPHDLLLQAHPLLRLHALVHPRLSKVHITTSHNRQKPTCSMYISTQFRKFSIGFGGKQNRSTPL